MSETDTPPPAEAVQGKRARNRAARHRNIVAAAAAIVTEQGLAGLTMQEVAERVDCAVGTIYTYFASKSALLAALQADAVRALTDSHDAAAGQWDDAIDELGLDEPTAALTRILALGRLVVSWPDLLPREFEFLQMLIGTPAKVISDADGAAVIPQVLRLFAEGRVAIDTAVSCGALRFDPDRPGDDSFARTVRWVGGLDGAIMVSAAARPVVEMDPDGFDRHRMAESLTVDLLRGWGASEELLRASCEAADELSRQGMLLPDAGGPS